MLSVENVYSNELGELHWFVLEILNFHFGIYNYSGGNDCVVTTDVLLRQQWMITRVLKKLSCQVFPRAAVVFHKQNP